jgi:hypothetical protein
VVERAQEQDGVDTRPGGGEVAGVADRHGDPAGPWGEAPGPVRVPGDPVDQVDVVAVGGQPGGVDAGAPADVQDPPGGRGEMPPDDLAGAQQLQLPEPPADPLPLVDLTLVVLDDLVGEPVHGQERLYSCTAQVLPSGSSKNR